MTSGMGQLTARQPQRVPVPPGIPVLPRIRQRCEVHEDLGASIGTADFVTPELMVVVREGVYCAVRFS